MKIDDYYRTVWLEGLNPIGNKCGIYEISGEYSPERK